MTAFHRTIAAAALLVIACGPSVQAAENLPAKPGRPCKASDLVGTWQLKTLVAQARLNKKDPFVWDHQRVRFTADGGTAQIVSEKPLDQDPAALKRFAESLTVSTYAVDERGILSVSKLESPDPENCLCVIATADPSPAALAKLKPEQLARAPKKGDLLLTYLGSNRKPLLTKVFRKVA